MNKTNFLSGAVIVLILLNVSIISFLFFSHKGHDRIRPGEAEKIGADTFIKDRFGFSDDQMKLFSLSKEKHNEQSSRLNKELSELSKSYYLAFGNLNVQDSIWLKISDLNEMVYQVNSNHFEEVSNICTEEQKPELDKFINGLLERAKRGGPPRGGQKRKRPK